MVPLAIAATSASAAPVRSAITTDYTSTKYLHDALGLASTDADPAIDTITYGHFQWLLQQSGQFAVLIGDPATDTRFVERAQDVEAAARAAGVDTVYWFNPNLSGSARVAGIRQPPLDIRDPASATSLNANAQTIYGHAWKVLVSRSLGNGVTWRAVNDLGDPAPYTTEPRRPEIVNDSGAGAGQSTEVGDPAGGALYDYSATDTPADVSDTYFFVYDKDGLRGGQTQRIVSWVNLSEQADSSAARADVTTAIGAVSGTLDAPAQFDWWKSDVNERQSAGSTPASNGDIPVLTDADADWRVEQLTYPELIHLLESDATVGRDAVVLLGGAWCPNTRPVLPAINKYAQDNDVHVFNYDTVLDGANMGYSGTASGNPFQTRNIPQSTGSHPSFLYGHLFDGYIHNAKTQYQVTGSNAIPYFPAGDTTRDSIRVARLQVPYLFAYQGRGSTSNGPHDGVTRQWIQDNGGGAYREYMTSWPVANPLPNRLGLPIPLDAPIWATINDQLARFTYQSDPAPLYPNTGTDADATDYLGGSDTATVAYVAPSGSRPASVRVTSGGSVAISPAALSAALSTLGAAAPANYVAARTAWLAAYDARDDVLRDNLTPVVGAWGVAQGRKGNVINAWGTVSEATGVAGGLRAIRAADIFFGGLPGGVVSTQTVTAESVKQGTAPTISIAIANDFGRVATGNVSLVVTQGGTTVSTASAAVADNAATFTLPALAAGTYDYTLSYQADAQLLAFSKTGTFTVTPPDEVPPPHRDPDPTPPVVVPPVVVPPVVTPPVVRPPVTKPPAAQRAKARKVSGGVAKAPTSRRGGTYKVTIAVPKGRAAATGRVKITLKKGKATKTVSGRLTRGTVTLKVPKLAKGTWRVTISWPGDARYRAVSFAGTSIKVTK